MELFITAVICKMGWSNGFPSYISHSNSIYKGVSICMNIELVLVVSMYRSFFPYPRSN